MKKLDRKRCHLSACCSVLCRRYGLLGVVVPLLVLLYWIHTTEWASTLCLSTAVHPAGGGADTPQTHPQEAVGAFLVDTPTCQIPNVDPFDPTVRKFIRPPERLNCHRGSPPLTYSDLDSVYLLTERQHLYGASPPLTTISCCTRDISWDDDVEGKYANLSRTSLMDYAERKASLSPECRPLVDRYTPHTAGGVEVLCHLNRTVVYRDYHHFVPLLPRVEAASRRRTSRDEAPSVLIFMFDSLSRLQFHRWFPRTRRLLYEKMDAYELGGLNKNGDNTWPNVVQLLAGMDAAELERACAPNTRKDPLDGCPFMWREFRRAGYRTALAEDSPRMGMFNYLKVGFVRQPTDYYTRPTAVLSDKHIAYDRPLNTFLCEGGRPSHEFTFKFAEHLATRLKDRPYWGFVSQSAFSHDYFNTPFYLDVPYHRLLESLLASGALDNTVLVTMGDHGLRWGPERRTFIGALEERLPLVSLYFPRWLRSRYPKAFENLRANQRRLTTFRDVHRTLLDLLTPEVSLGDVDGQPVPSNDSMVSLFRRISPLRRCEHVQVPHHYCTCLHTQEVSVDDASARGAAAAVLRAVNAELAAAPQCAQLTLARVLSARLAWPPNADSWSRANVLRQMATVQIETAPGGAQFEATVLGNGTALLLSGAVSRLNSYGRLRQCVSDHRLEKLCHCRDEVPAGKSPQATPRPTAAGDSSGGQPVRRQGVTSSTPRPDGASVEKLTQTHRPKK